MKTRPCIVSRFILVYVDRSAFDGGHYFSSPRALVTALGGKRPGSYYVYAHCIVRQRFFRWPMRRTLSYASHRRPLYILTLFPIKTEALHTRVSEAGLCRPSGDGSGLCSDCPPILVPCE